MKAHSEVQPLSEREVERILEAWLPESEEHLGEEEEEAVLGKEVIQGHLHPPASATSAPLCRPLQSLLTLLPHVPICPSGSSSGSRAFLGAPPSGSHPRAFHLFPSRLPKPQ